MSGDISKMSVVDSRIVQPRPAYAVEKGALSLTNAPFNAVSATTSQHTYNVYVPSENVFVDRHILWTSGVNMSGTVTSTSSTAGATVLAPGVDFALAPLPLNQLCSTIQATINDTASVINSQDVLTPVLRLTDMAENRLCRTAPTMLDTYASYNDAAGSAANPLAGYEFATEQDRVPNGAHPGLVFTDSNGTSIGLANTYNGATNSTPAYTGASFAKKNGVLVFPQTWQGAGGPPAVSTVAYAVGDLVQYLGVAYTCIVAQPIGSALPPNANWTTGLTLTAALPFYFRWTSTEPIVLSPFVFADEHEWSTGLFGINNIQVLMNLQSSPSRVIRSSSKNGRTITAVAYNPVNTFVNPQVNCQFLTPALEIPLPPKSVVPYMEYPRYISQAVTVAANSESQIQSQTITLPSIPDLLLVYAKPTAYADLTNADWILPITSSQTGGTRNPLSINFDNFSGLLSSHTSEELFAMARKNGLQMDWPTWCGVARSATANTGTQAGAFVQTVGGLLVLKPSQDITLQSGQAPSLVGNFTLQMNVTVYNPTAAPVPVQLFIVTVNSGFFETIRGSSRIIKGVLSEQDVIDAPRAGAMARNELERMVGAGFSMKSLGNVLSKAHQVYNATKPAVEMAQSLAKEITGKKGSGSGAGRSGAGKGLESRLM